MSRPSVRQLIWVPVIHTEADLGSMSQAIRQIYARRLGKGQWDRHRQAVEELWGHIRADIEALNLDCTHVRLYQDGLPNSCHEADIVRDLAQAGSLNHRLLLELMERGAHLTGTEAPELLLEEYELARQVLATLSTTKATAPRQRRQEDVSKSLLERRDRYIAARIAATLQAGETGLIFLGMLHALEGRLPADMTLSRLGSPSRLLNGARAEQVRRRTALNKGDQASEQD